ncbi:putative bifunctional diguanylate cyclase/phosphodiesterase [Kineococcus rubinsiae]|uniref:putative bifunctional diguanylate cyclase/phosphodiesterase n=1 Tax=Kineococcus rubinsiae TaxID=2609562 RepID=UPI0014313077|nr:bifunctional diguanylate cyclase/phosphodiesterase [Kineococcus rubinsiae]NIZ93266.1 bifunctional diguanylate cyclase/phosphodiesterase [Kineococcus rubinsiae]
MSRGRWGLVAAVAGIVALCCALPAAVPPVLVAVHAAALLAGAAGVRRHRPAGARTWAAVLLVLGAGLVTAVVREAADDQLAAARQGLGVLQVAALALAPALVRSLRLPRRGSRVTWPDLALTACGAGLVLVQLLAMQHAAGAPAAALAVTSAATLVTVVLLRLLSTRDGLSPATALVLLAIALLVGASDVVTTEAGVRGQTVVLGVVAAAACALLALAAQQPGLRHLGTPFAGGTLRRDGQRLLTTVPVFCVVPLLWGLGALGLLPQVALEVVTPSGYVLACAGVFFAARSLTRAERAAERDPLTDLVNRRGLHRATTELRQRLHEADVHLCLIDLDDFKQINDTRGHAVGDALLVDVADRLRAAVGTDGVVSRTGGDEFIVVLGTSPLDEEGPGDRLLTALDAPFDTGGVPSPVTASVGIAPLPAGVPLSTALVDADVAMYAAKQAGKGRSLVYRPQLREQVLGGLARQGELRQMLLQGAPPEEVGELVVVHQPIVGLQPLRVVGTEALVRWRHPREGLLMPDEFLHHAEAAGLGARLDEHVAQLALAHLAGWDAAGLPPLDLSVNLGVGSLHRRGIGRWVAALADRHGIAHERVHLEITEHEELPDDPLIAESLREVVAAGFHLDLDDFGIGYTSLSYLRRFPVSTVKLDRSLTMLISDGGDVPLLQGIAALCRALDMRMLAEGVEQEDQIEVLRTLGVDLAQGHHFGVPMGAGDVPGFVRRTAAGLGTPARRGDDVLI